MTAVVICLVVPGLALAACAASMGGQTLHQPAEPWNGNRQNLRWSERVALEPSTGRPALFVDLAIPVGRPGAYGFDAPCITPANRESPCVSRGLPPAMADVMRAGNPFVRFEADSSLVGHVTLRFPGRELERMPQGGRWGFRVNLYRVVSDTVLVAQEHAGGLVDLKIMLAPHTPGEFRGK